MRNVRRVLNKCLDKEGLKSTGIKDLEFIRDCVKTKVYLNLENIIWNYAYQLKMRVKL